MELQLGLSLPIHDLSNNGFNFEPKKKLGSKPWTRDGSYKKRSFKDAFGENEEHPSPTLPLLLWSGQPNDDDDKGGKKKISCVVNKNEEGEGNQVVGWPPIKSWRKKVLHRDQDDQRANNQMAAGNENGGTSNTTYVKVKMEGVAIARKIDLKLFHSYQTLKLLDQHFAMRQICDKEGACYTLTYQDKDGDWLVAGDVPWQTFIESVQRLEIVRNGG